MAFRPDRAAEADVFEPPKTNEIPLQEALGRRVVRADLGSRFTHEHPRQERIIRHVASYPELFGLDVLVAGNDVMVAVDVHDAVQLLHLKSLRVHLPDRFKRGHDLGKIQASRVEVKFGRHHQLRAGFWPEPAWGGRSEP
jgi:hypothetical protein